MTQTAYTENPDDGIDASHLVGEDLTSRANETFEAYRAALAENERCPCYRHAKRVVDAYSTFHDAMEKL